MFVRRTTVAVAAIAAAGLVPALGSAATAAGHGPGGHGGGHGSAHAASAQTRQLTHQISVLDARLSRLEGSDAVTGLDDTEELALDANIDADRAQLADLAAGVSALAPADVRAERRQLQSFRVENYVLAVTILESAADLADAAATVPAAQDELDRAVTAALELTASSTRSDVRDARSHIDAAQTAIDDAGAIDDSGDDSGDGSVVDSGDDATA
ncbi:MAG TPA: hypothetical protein VN088_10880 [Nocardioides sp.]|nr:hypothetical protein [Nocardioides sp.]